MSKFHYVYFLTDCATGTHHYVGYTSLKPSERLAVHNSGSVPHTSKFRPWQITAAIAVDSEAKAIELENTSNLIPDESSQQNISDFLRLLTASVKTAKADS